MWEFWLRLVNISIPLQYLEYWGMWDLLDKRRCVLISSSQLNCCGPTGTVIDAAKDICPKKEGLEALITTVRAPHKRHRYPALCGLAFHSLPLCRAIRAVRLLLTRCSTTNCTSSAGSASVSASSWWACTNPVNPRAAFEMSCMKTADLLNVVTSYSTLLLRGQCIFSLGVWLKAYDTCWNNYMNDVNRNIKHTGHKWCV